MGKAKIILWHNNRYKGSLNDNECDILEQLIELDECNGCVADLRHVIRNLSKSDIETIKFYGMDWKLMRNTVELENRVGTLADYQTVGVAYAYWAKKCLIGDSQGMGKTAISAGLCNLLRAEYAKKGKDFKFLFLAEKASASDLRDKMIQFTGTYVDLCYGEQKSSQEYVKRNFCDGACYSLVASHSIMKQGIFLDWLVSYKQETGSFPFDLIIVDESTVVSGSKTGYAEAIKNLLDNVDRAVFLNATPVEVNAKTMYNQLDLLDPTLLPVRSTWSKEFEIYDYRGMYPKATGKYKNPEEFKRRCLYRYFARTRKDKGAVMENCTGRKMVCDLSQVQKYWLSRSSIKQLVYDCPSYFDDSIEFCSENVPKLKCLLYLLENDCENASSIILFTHYKETLNHLKDWFRYIGVTSEVLNGDVTKASDKQEIINGFREGKFRVLLTNITKSLDFDNCDHCIFYSFDPNPSKMIQSEGRIERTFDIINKNVYLLVSRGEEYKRLESVIKDRTTGAVGFTNRDYSLIRDIILGEEMVWDVTP